MNILGTNTCAKKYDVVFIVDRSKFTGPAVYRRYIDRVKDIVRFLDVGDDRTRLSFLLFNQKTMILSKLNELNNAAFFNNFLMNGLRNPNGKRNLDQALKTVRKEVT